MSSQIAVTNWRAIKGPNHEEDGRVVTIFQLVSVKDEQRRYHVVCWPEIVDGSLGYFAIMCRSKAEAKGHLPKPDWNRGCAVSEWFNKLIYGSDPEIDVPEPLLTSLRASYEF